MMKEVNNTKQKGFTPLKQIRPKAAVAVPPQAGGRARTGFTLIELVVATGLLAMFLVIFSGIFSTFVTTQRRDSSRQLVLEQLRMALEVMSRELRISYGTSYALTDSQGRGIMFRNQNGLCVHYRLREGQIERAEELIASSTCPNRSFSARSYAALTSEDVNIEFLRFDPVAAQVGESLSDIFPESNLENQGFVTIMVSAESQRVEIPAVKLQTTVTSRQVIPYGAN